LKFNPQVQPAPRDYLQTIEGLMFAVVNAELIQSDRIVCCLRYIPTTDGLRKLTTSDAIAYLQANHPQYLYPFEQLDTLVHVVPLLAIQCHYQPVSRLQQICEQPLDDIEESTVQAATYFISQGIDSDSLGISGSILISAHGAKSDIDLVVYGRDNFFKARNSLQQLFMSHQTQHLIQPLSDEQWQQTWQRRGCDSSLQDYIWHEQRKYNKASINGIKFDLSMVEVQATDHQIYKKQGITFIKAVITDDSKAYDYPASYLIDHPEINQILSYSATYAGQACQGESIEARGIVEKSSSGHCRLLVGASREATGQYLKVVDSRCGNVATLSINV
jgi:predicted nucleotidyltransferase